MCRCCVVVVCVVVCRSPSGAVESPSIRRQRLEATEIQSIGVKNLEMESARMVGVADGAQSRHAVGSGFGQLGGLVLADRSTSALVEPYGARLAGWLDRLVITVTGALPDNRLGLRLAILLRRIVTMRLADDAGIDVERWGQRMRLHPRRNGCEKGALFTPQMYEVREREALASAVDGARAARRQFVFVDIGANIGLFSLFVASRAGPQARILAFEPEPECVRRMQFNIDANPGIPIRLFAHALGDSSGNVLLDVDPRDRGGTHVRRPDEVGERPAVVVACRQLLDVLTQEEVRSIDALKIDVEGVEDTVLMPFFRDAPPSLWPQLLIIEDTSGMWRSDLFSELGALGYTTLSRTRQNVILRR
jgi:FkbM family methyltransferase